MIELHCSICGKLRKEFFNWQMDKATLEAATHAEHMEKNYDEEHDVEVKQRESVKNSGDGE